MTTLLLVCLVGGAVWGAWLGRREAAHGGVGIGLLGFAGGMILGAVLGGAGYLAGLTLGLILLVAAALATAVVVTFW